MKTIQAEILTIKAQIEGFKELIKESEEVLDFDSSDYFEDQSYKLNKELLELQKYQDENPW